MDDEDKVPEVDADDKVFSDLEGCGGAGSFGSCGFTLDNGFGTTFIIGGCLGLGGGCNDPSPGTFNFGTAGFGFAFDPCDPDGRFCAIPDSSGRCSSSVSTWSSIFSIVGPADEACALTSVCLLDAFADSSNIFAITWKASLSVLAAI